MKALHVFSNMPALIKQDVMWNLVCWIAWSALKYFKVRNSFIFGCVHECDIVKTGSLYIGNQDVLNTFGLNAVSWECNLWECMSSTVV